MYAVRRSSPPKQMFVVRKSPVSTCSMTLPAGEITVMPADSAIVATQTLPAPSTASESSSDRPGSPHSNTAPKSSGATGATSPGFTMRRWNTRPVCVSA